MGIRDYINQFTARAEAMKQAQAEDALLTGLDAVALMKSRVQQQGLNSESQQFEDYTPDYSRQRKNEGYQVAYVDFTKTGEMYASVTPQVIQADATGATVEIKARTQGNQNKINGQFKKRGNILLNTGEELQILGRAHAERQINRIR